MTARIINRFFGKPVAEPVQITVTPRDYTLDDWLDQNPGHLTFFTKMNYGKHEGKIECVLNGAKGSTEIKAYGYGRTTGDAFYDAIANVEKAIGRQVRR